MKQVELTKADKNMIRSLKETRQASNMSQKQLGDLCGVSIQSIKHWEGNRCAPSLENIKKLRVAYEMMGRIAEGINVENIELNLKTGATKETQSKKVEVDNQNRTLCELYLKTNDVAFLKHLNF